MLTNYFLNAIVSNVYNTTEKTAELPTDFYLGFSKTEPSVDGTGVSEPLAENNYAREHISAFKMSDTVGYVENVDSFTTNEATNDGWGYLPYFCIFDAQTGGNLLVFGSYTNPKSIEAESVGVIGEGAIKLSITNE